MPQFLWFEIRVFPENEDQECSGISVRDSTNSMGVVSSPDVFGSRRLTGLSTLPRHLSGQTKTFGDETSKYGRAFDEVVQVYHLCAGTNTYIINYTRPFGCQPIKHLDSLILQVRIDPRSICCEVRQH